MKRNMMGRNLRRSIVNSLGRYIAIATIIALGTAIFVGLRSTKMDMVATGQAYTDSQNMFDLRFISTYGWEPEQVEEIAALEGLEDVEGVFYADLIAQSEKSSDALVYRFYTVPESINRLVLLEGRMPERADECLADGFRNDESVIGTKVTVSRENSDDALDQLEQREFTVVGLVSSPLYMDTNRGNTSVGSGSIANFFFVPADAFDISYYTEVHATIPGDYQIYSQEYNDAMEQAADLLKPELEAIAQARVDSIRQDAMEEYEDGLADYNQAEADYQKEKADALRQLDEAKADLEQAEAELAGGQTELENGRQQLSDSRAQLEQQLQAYGSNAQLQAYEQELNQQEQQLIQAQAELDENRQKLAEGWADWEQSKQETQEKFSDAEAELAEAEQELQDAWNEIQDIADAEVYVLDRNSNVGYCSLDSNSDIVAGVARVFPAFFLLVAALVCITTMTRMVEEERTQIGTLKALGYGNGAIVSKYLLYSGSSAILGCTMGVILGSIVFPIVLWQAYKIILVVTPNILLRFDWKMALSVTALYTLAMLAVSWYCCHRALQEVPAELIRPKAPGAGKKLLIERIPLWERVSFLNKVAIRNIFRYRQRLVMMLLGIGGCTALLMTGFGIRDSIAKIVDVQFRDVTQYDLAVNFRSGQTERQQEQFRKAMEEDAEEILFFHQVSGTIETDSQSRDIYIMAAGEQIKDFVDFHWGKEPVALPGENEVLLSSGMAEILDIQIGDTVVLRDPDLQELSVRVSGIYENHIYNYALVTPETIRQQWGTEPEMQSAYVTVREGRNPDNAGATASGLDGVSNVLVSQQIAESVNGMMSALDLVVVVVVLCAGVLGVIVLYNLTNININERIREIATIKVLGFNARETGMYVFKENLVLSAFGVLVGIPMGKLLLEFVMSQIKIDMIWIKPLFTMPSLLASVALTICSALVVDCLFYSSLDRINMAEALKSVE
ncbi:MAG: ABC transporter permease [Firmicutes bacterium]|nr:ABC transporter permease [Bacillota bacterium]MDY6160677.1 FtsX-like permease family protein [Candidatus Faecousia sp.]